jgi:hypothetical protein
MVWVEGQKEIKKNGDEVGDNKGGGGRIENKGTTRRSAVTDGIPFGDLEGVQESML